MVRGAFEEFTAGAFYRSYRGSYYADAVLKDVFGQRLRKHGVRFKGYEEVWEKNLLVMGDFLDWAEQARWGDEALRWRVLESLCLDPDPWSVQEVDGIVCGADGLISLKRLHARFGPSKALLEAYKRCRRVAIFHFPAERGGINSSRARVFGDRIDHCLLDIKGYCEGAPDCRLQKAFRQPKTEQWLERFGRDFSELVDWWGGKGFFTDDSYAVYDLEQGGGAILLDYRDSYPREWSDAYYRNLTAVIDRYPGKRGGDGNSGSAPVNPGDNLPRAAIE